MALSLVLVVASGCSSSKHSSKPVAPTTTRPTAGSAAKGPVAAPKIKADLEAFPSWCSQIEQAAHKSPFDDAAKRHAIDLLERSPVKGTYAAVVKRQMSGGELRGFLLTVADYCRTLGYLR